RRAGARGSAQQGEHLARDEVRFVEGSDTADRASADRRGRYGVPLERDVRLRQPRRDARRRSGVAEVRETDRGRWRSLDEREPEILPQPARERELFND